MIEQNTTTTTTTSAPAPSYPGNWRIASDYDPNDHLMNLKGRDYLNVQNRLLWFIRDQRDFIVRGLATTTYVIRTELIEQDREAGYAHFRTYVRDVLGNEAVMYGSETVRDFGDYAEKASTKSLGRALLALGYGTAFAPEMDEGDRVVDAPVERDRDRDRDRARPPLAVVRPTQPQADQAEAPVAETPAPPAPATRPAKATSNTDGYQPEGDANLVRLLRDIHIENVAAIERFAADAVKAHPRMGKREACYKLLAERKMALARGKTLAAERQPSDTPASLESLPAGRRGDRP